MGLQWGSAPRPGGQLGSRAPPAAAAWILGSPPKPNIRPWELAVSERSAVSPRLLEASRAFAGEIWWLEVAEVTRGALGPSAGGGSQPAAGMELGGLRAPSQPYRSALLRSQRFLPTRPFCGCSSSLCTERGWRLCFRKHRLGLEGTLKIIQQTVGQEGTSRVVVLVFTSSRQDRGAAERSPQSFLHHAITLSPSPRRRCSVPCVFSPGHGAEAIPAPPCWGCLVFCAPNGGQPPAAAHVRLYKSCPTPGKQLGAARRPGARCARQECGSALRRCPDSASYHPPGFCWVSGLEHSQHQFGALRDPGGQLWDPTSIQHGQVRSVDPISIQHGQVRSWDPIQHGQVRSWDPTSIQHGQVRSVDPTSIQHGQVRSWDPTSIQHGQVRSVDPTSIQHGQVRSVDPISIQHGQVRSVGSHIHTAWPGEVMGSHIHTAWPGEVIGSHTAWPGEVSGIPYSMAR
ncbi:uncharacterized protein LOC128073177 isoform X9 [Tympanuchus pallidicinctus]|uniref:uncharacterized protein LOC128073177 isoform X8 n=1 Tax=Tympanuchus pallidicinctus TaxID=109042 RepID=UPI0022872305|nr:uncharacterized protein LOC128073177 isoform X8 [Tympanuchus pallidicinctus]XP_052523753.1 uncharacterized protein LOC128073177 isoform X9 [Tympanuchus pallidicinctus]